MTNGWVDIKNADMMLVMGGNPAENHPCGFKWVIEAKRTRNAKLMVIDPRYTRTVLGMCLSAIANGPINGTSNFGVFRM